MIWLTRAITAALSMSLTTYPSEKGRIEMRMFNGHHSANWFIRRGVTKCLWQHRRDQVGFYAKGWWYVWHNIDNPLPFAYETQEQALNFACQEALYRCYPQCKFYIRQAKETYSADVLTIPKLR